jgi:hypothetical protein
MVNTKTSKEILVKTKVVRVACETQMTGGEGECEVSPQEAGLRQMEAVGPRAMISAERAILP